jgi:ATP-dependent exoDNAse (exonuclease V) alpha subunit
MTQKKALEILKKGYNVFLTGPPGSGKTFLLNKFIRYLRSKEKRVAITASTGIAATHLGGLTIHSWSGIGIKTELLDSDINNLKKKYYIKKNLREVDVLIIDEISMLHAYQLDMIDKILRQIRKNPFPFGGIQVVLSGDLFQLPPVRKTGPVFKDNLEKISEEEKKATGLFNLKSLVSEKDLGVSFINKAYVWPQMNLKICYLKEQYRFSDNNLNRILSNLRQNKISKEDVELLKNSAKDSRNNQNKSKYLTKLYTHNLDVDSINVGELNKLKDKTYTYFMHGEGNEFLVDFIQKGSLISKELKLKKGAIVMFVKNNFEQGYVNGTLGEVIRFNEDNLPIVKTFDEKVITVYPAIWEIEDLNGEIKAQVEQLPLRLAWAITVHKSQGMSLDAAQIDLSKCFEFGMGYVAISRLKTLAGLSLQGFNKKALQVDPKILKLDQEFQDRSGELD